jgi:hypothetical protein
MVAAARVVAEAAPVVAGVPNPPFCSGWARTYILARNVFRSLLTGRSQPAGADESQTAWASALLESPLQDSGD